MPDLIDLLARQLLSIREQTDAALIAVQALQEAKRGQAEIDAASPPKTRKTLGSSRHHPSLEQPSLKSHDEPHA